MAILEQYIEWINSNEQTDLYYERWIFISALYQGNLGIAKLAIMRGILFGMDFKFLVRDLIPEWDVEIGTDRYVNTEIRDMVIDHIMNHIQQKDNPIYLCNDILNFIEKHLKNIDKLYCMGFDKSPSLINLTVLKCEMGITKILESLDTDKCKLIKISGHGDLQENKSNNIIQIPTLKTLEVYNVRQWLFNCLNFPNLRKLKLEFVKNPPSEFYRDKGNLGEIKCKYLEKLYMTRFNVVNTINLLRYLKTLKLTECIIHNDIRTVNLFMNNCVNSTQRGYYTGKEFHRYNSHAHISCVDAVLDKHYDHLSAKNEKII